MQAHVRIVDGFHDPRLSDSRFALYDGFILREAFRQVFDSYCEAFRCRHSEMHFDVDILEAFRWHRALPPAAKSMLGDNRFGSLNPWGRVALPSGLAATLALLP